MSYTSVYIHHIQLLISEKNVRMFGTVFCSGLVFFENVGQITHGCLKNTSHMGVGVMESHCLSVCLYCGPIFDQ